MTMNYAIYMVLDYLCLCLLIDQLVVNIQGVFENLACMHQCTYSNVVKPDQNTLDYYPWKLIMFVLVFQQEYTVVCII